MNKRILFLAALILALSFGCRKKVVPTQPIVEPPPPEPKKISFVFVNRIGFRNDSTKHGVNDTVFQGPCLDGKYYNTKTNITTLSNTCYNRNFPENNFPLKDSITFRAFESASGSKYGYQIELVWKCPTYPYTTKVLRYTTKNYIAGDTVKIEKDTVIKFIWPIDTASGNYIKTYQWP